MAPASPEMWRASRRFRACHLVLLVLSITVNYSVRVYALVCFIQDDLRSVSEPQEETHLSNIDTHTFTHTRGT